MDFFASQDDARRKTSLLIVYYALAVAFIILSVYVAVAAVFVVARSQSDSGLPPPAFWDPLRFLWITGITVGVVLLAMAYKVSQLSKGGETVAALLGGRPINLNTIDPNERKVLNVVEEMALASGTSVPRVFLLADEAGINAFAAGFTPSDAVIAVTRGCMEQLTRDELQGVIGHEFSHILNGDMRLNIRLLGVLNGILVIGIVGYWIFRSAFSGSSGSGSRRKGGGNPLPFLVLGLAVMAIGYIGVFFGKLIKSAVSRQREFLADAASVQFTRNPLGIAGALKKIGGYKRGSKVVNAHAAEASHFFFADGLSKSFANLMATHPPIEERIRRLDPSFTGVLKPAPRRADRAGAAAPAAASGFAIEPQEVVDRVGAPRQEHIEHATGIVSRLPDALRTAVREPFGAVAVVYNLLLNSEAGPRQAQLTRLAEHADAPAQAETQRLMPLLTGLGADLRLPLVDLAVGALKDLSNAQYARFRSNIDHLVAADQRIDLFEYALQRIIKHRLGPLFTPGKRPVVQYYSLKPLLPACAELLSCLAYAGTDDEAASARAYAAGTSRLEVAGVPAMTAVRYCGLQRLDEALNMLGAASPVIKKRIIDACSACIGADGHVTVDEAELLRAVAATLDCPIPPFLPGD